MRPARRAAKRVRERAAQIGAAEDDRLDALADQRGRQLAADGLDFGQFRHGGRRQSIPADGAAEPRAARLVRWDMSYATSQPWVSQAGQPTAWLVSWTQLIYALHAVSLLTGILGAATVVGAFLIGWPSIIAVILNYMKRGEARGTWLESHFRWQIRTFWFGLLWVALCVAVRHRHASASA